MLTGDRLRPEFAADFLDEHNGVAERVAVEDVGRQGVATPVAHAAVGVDDDSCHGVGTGKVSGSASTDLSAAV